MNFTDPAPLSIPTLLFNLLLGLGLSVLLAIYYAKLGDSLTNRSKFAPILPLLSMITLLVISVVKSSLALSLGLVGALSIVRFRTAIKDPEELIFLFFAVWLLLLVDGKPPQLSSSIQEAANSHFSGSRGRVALDPTPQPKPSPIEMLKRNR